MPTTATATLAHVPATTPRKPCPAPTYSATETLPDGRERILVAGLSYCRMLGHRFEEQTWAVAWTKDVPEGREETS